EFDCTGATGLKTERKLAILGDQSTRSPGNDPERLSGFDEARERRRRIAYEEGWHACQEEMKSLLTRLGVMPYVDVENVYDHCADYHVTLYEWRLGDCSREYEPPPPLPEYSRDD
ncbi:MAG: hypothetical protein ACRDHE_18085, partial [Ktedonobacterales bacterium]